MTTGMPIVFKCPGCRSIALIEGKIVRTGRSRDASDARYGPRLAWQFRCLNCGRVGWSKHRDVELAPTAQEGRPS